MEKLKAKSNTLAIVGNGFDLAHHYKTSYVDFIKSVGTDYFSEYRDYLVTYCGNDNEWNNFEKKVEILVSKFYKKDIFDGGLDTNIILNFNHTFLNIQRELIEYLKKEIESKRFQKIEAISKYLGKDTIVINFNYTDIVENYSNRVIYVHGSIKENEIVLGYDPEDPFCLASYENRKWFKDFARERLTFKRYIKQQFNLLSSDMLYKELISEYEQVQKMKNSSKGLEPENICSLKHANFFNQCCLIDGDYNSDISIPLDVPFNMIDKLIVLGHSIKSDKNFLKRILSRCSNLQQVILFTYKKEGEKELNAKIQFLSSYCKNIKIETT